MFSKPHCARNLLLTVFLIGVTAGASAQANFSFSCLIDGQSFSQSGTSTISNTAFRTAPDIINVSLVSLDPKYNGSIPPQIALYISPNGTTTIKGSGGKYTAKYSPPGQLDNDYVAQSVTVNVTSLTASRITGTFSGKFANNSKAIMITNGKFDFPASKYSKPLK